VASYGIDISRKGDELRTYVGHRASTVELEDMRMSQAFPYVDLLLQHLGRQ
jgi:hypothetical protein